MLEQNAIIHSELQEDSGSSSPGWRPLYLFNLYRLVVAATFLLSLVTGVAPHLLGQTDWRLFAIVSGCYAGFALFSAVAIEQQWLSFSIQILGQGIVDIAAIILLMHASGGVDSGLGVLLVAAIAGSSLLTEGRTALFFAAVASLGVLIQVSLTDLVYYDLSFNSYTHASMLGTSFFATALLAYTLARRIRVADALAKQRGVHLQFLAQLNEQIVQHIQSGIVVIDIVGRIRWFNEAARRLLGLNEIPHERALSAITPELAEQVKDWQKHLVLTNTALFRPERGEVDLIATFTELQRGGSVNVLIMLEDATLTAQRAQQLKLASLGRLTASIAHEIRNPLGAISHAGQLLAESSSISPADSRLTQIIIENSQRINSIIDNILQLSRRGQTNILPINLPLWLRTFVDEFASFHRLPPNAVVIHSHHPSLEVAFDPIHLYQVLTNLCENGLRYSQGIPLLELTLDLNEESQRSYLEIRDHGKGMTEAVKAQIFEPFFTTEAKGNGLGLYLARELCEANQASLHLVSHMAVGCCFRIHFSPPLSVG